MNQRPFISTQLNIFDENRCVFSPSMIGGQPVMISQEQNRKICDSTTTAIASNQLRNNPYFCASPLPATYSNQPQIWSCPLQAQKQGVPGGVVFNFSQPNYCCPPSCLPSVYNPPPPPCPQLVDCLQKTPQSICADFGKYGMEAMAFQQKCRLQCQGFTYDKQVGTCDQILFPKGNTCCCGVQSVTLNAEQKEQMFHKIDETGSKSKLKVCARDPVEKRRCICLPKPNPNKFGSAKTLVIGERKERCCKDYDIVDQATREADAEEYLCCDCLDKWKKKNENRRPSCLKNKSECFEEKGNDSRDVSFCFRGKTLEITEEKRTGCKSVEQPANQPKIEDISSSKTPPSSENDNSDIVKYINEMKGKRRGIVKMTQDFKTTAKDYLEQLDRDIDHFRVLHKMINTRKIRRENYIDRYKLKQLFDHSEFEHDENDVESSQTTTVNTKTVTKENTPISQQKQNESQRTIRETKSEEKKTPSGTLISKNPNEEKSLTKSVVKFSDSEHLEKQSGDIKAQSNHDSTMQIQNKVDTPARNKKLEDKASCNEKNIVDKEDSITLEYSENLKLDQGVEGEASAQNTVSADSKLISIAESSKLESGNTEDTKEFSDAKVISKQFEEETNYKKTNIGEVHNLKEFEVQKNGTTNENKEEKPDESINGNTEIKPNKPSEPASDICIGNCVCYEITDDEITGEINEDNVVDNKEPVEFLNDKIIQVKQSTNDVQTFSELEPEGNFSQINEPSTSSQKKTQHLDNVSFSAQPPSASDERAVGRTNQNEDQSTPEPQTSASPHIENTCGCNNYCRKIMKYSSDRKDDETKTTEARILNTQECNCCDCNARDDEDSGGTEELVFRPCRGGRSPLSTVGQIISNIYSSTIEKTGRLLNCIIGRRSPCAPTSQPFYENPRIITNRYGCDSGCYDRRIKRYLSELDRPRNICSRRLSTNRFCGKTCYDYETNRWYSCCDGFSDEQKVVKITFKETAKRRTIRLDNNCRNSRYLVVFE